MTAVEQLIEISRHFGSDSRHGVADGGYTSYKDADRIWVKANGRSLKNITEEGFAVSDRAKLSAISTKTYSDETAIREEQFGDDLSHACITKSCRPNIETSIHNAIGFSFVVHLQPTLVNALMCSQECEKLTGDIFMGEALYIPYTDPGYTLFKEIEKKINDYEKSRKHRPNIIMLQNHGIFVAGDSMQQIIDTYTRITSAIELLITSKLPQGEVKTGINVKEVVPAIRMMLSGEGIKNLLVTASALTEYFGESEEMFSKISRPFTPGIIAYCNSAYLYFYSQNLDHIEKEIGAFKTRYGIMPKVVLIKGLGMISVGETAAQCALVSDVFTDMMKIAFMAQSFGGQHPLTRQNIDTFEDWKEESYRCEMPPSFTGRAQGKIVIVTGAAQGFGEGIAECFVKQGANVVIADMNQTAGNATAEKLNTVATTNRAIFVQTDVTKKESLDNLIHETVCAFGGLDLFVSNAGVLRAGGLEDMDEDTFEFVTKVNYSAYFYCAKAAAPVMKLQTKFKADYYCDIVQINSKSGLRGSKANFAYAGGKFGGVGLTQSFALELAPFRIKVNSICPGNFYEGPLWADPENGLFVQYLKAGKVPGAQTIEDVRKFYMAQVPMGKGTSPEDVTRAILYAMEQTCETGQAIPVTGGQVMMN